VEEGKVIAELKKQGVYNNTLIIFTTDNGVSAVPCCTRICVCACATIVLPYQGVDRHVISLFIIPSLSYFPAYYARTIFESIPYHATLYIVTQLSSLRFTNYRYMQ
jgi:arylsulfatase A-like enzyme